MISFTSLLASYDLVIDNYEVRQTNGLVKTVSLLVDNATVFTDVILNGKCITGNKALDMLKVLTENDISKVQIVSKHELARKRRHDRRREYDYCPALFEIIKLINDEPEEEYSRYDNHINSELLPDYTIRTNAVYEEDELFQLNPVVRIESEEEIKSPYQWNEDGFKIAL